MSAFLELQQVTKIYPTSAGPAVIVENFDLSVRRGEFVCVIGHSGCGKSTVLSTIAGLIPLSRGQILLDGQAIAGPGPDRGVVFQAPCLLPWFTALDNVKLGINQVFGHLSRKERDEIACHVLDLVGLADAMYKKPAELSVGMKQCVGLARAFALSPKMLLLDEPFGMLDSLSRLEMQEVLQQLWSEDQKTAFMVTHDVDEALFLADRIVMMTNGPAAKVGDILAVPFPHPRDRKSVLEHPDYYPLRESLIAFLEDQATHQPVQHTPSPSP